jgi:hypothetical protein
MVKVFHISGEFCYGGYHEATVIADTADEAYELLRQDTDERDFESFKNRSRVSISEGYSVGKGIISLSGSDV